MAVRLMFPTYVFHRNLLEYEDDERRGCSKNYLNLLKNEIDQIRTNDPKGRRISNAYTGWQSHDIIQDHPAFQKLMRLIVQTVNDEILPFHALDKKQWKVAMGNSWANINDKSAWNKPHLHNGCWYSGVFYIKADGDEGDLVFIDRDTKVVADFPPSARTPCSFNFTPQPGELVLFPSGAMHMVEPNLTNKDRYSISFNLVHEFRGKDIRSGGQHKDWNPDEFVFDIDPKGNPIF